MITKNLTYEDFNGVKRTETFYFNLTQAELTDWELSVAGGMSAYIQRIADAKSERELIGLFKGIIDRSYGVKSPDGRRFMKSPELLEEFKSTQAYSDFYMSLVTNTQNALDFINALTPNAPKAENAAAQPQLTVG